MPPASIPGRRFFIVAALLSGASPLVALPQGYTTLTAPQPTPTTGRVEVIEFFWYGCPHCYELEPAIERWLARVPPDVDFRRVPAIPSERWAPAARLFFTLKAMGLIDRLHRPVFDAIHREKVALERAPERDGWLSRMGVDLEKFRQVESSFAVASEVNRARAMTAAYQVDSVPRVVIDGRYITSPEQAGGTERVFAAVDEAVARARGRIWVKPPPR